MSVDSLDSTVTTVFVLSKASSPLLSGTPVLCGGLGAVVRKGCVRLAMPNTARRCLERLDKDNKIWNIELSLSTSFPFNLIENWWYFKLNFEIIQGNAKHRVSLYLKDFIVEVILKGLAILRVFLLLLELLVCFGAGAAASPGALLLCLVPLLLLVTIHLGGQSWRQLHPCRGFQSIEILKIQSAQSAWAKRCNEHRPTISHQAQKYTHTGTSVWGGRLSLVPFSRHPPYWR